MRMYMGTFWHLFLRPSGITLGLVHLASSPLVLERVSCCTGFVLLGVWCVPTGILVHPRTHGLCEDMMVESTFAAGRCMQSPGVFESWSSPISNGFDAGVGFDWGWTSIQLNGMQICKGKLLLRQFWDFNGF